MSSHRTYNTQIRRKNGRFGKRIFPKKNSNWNEGMINRQNGRFVPKWQPKNEKYSYKTKNELSKIYEAASTLRTTQYVDNNITSREALKIRKYYSSCSFDKIPCRTRRKILQQNVLLFTHSIFLYKIPFVGHYDEQGSSVDILVSYLLTTRNEEASEETLNQKPTFQRKRTSVRIQRLKALQNPSEHFGQELVLHNVVSRFELNTSLDLPTIARNLWNIEHKMGSKKAVYRPRIDHCLFTIWKSGVVLLMGASSESTARSAASKFLQKVNRIYFNANQIGSRRYRHMKIQNFEIINVRGCYRFPFGIDITSFSNDSIKNAVMYEPEIHPGASTTLCGCHVWVYSTGSVILHGRNTASLKDAIEKLWNQLYPYRRLLEIPQDNHANLQDAHQVYTDLLQLSECSTAHVTSKLNFCESLGDVLDDWITFESDSFLKTLQDYPFLI